MGDALCRPPGSPGVPLTGLASGPARGLRQTSRGLLERLGPCESAVSGAPCSVGAAPPGDLPARCSDHPAACLEWGKDSGVVSPTWGLPRRPSLVKRLLTGRTQSPNLGDQTVTAAVTGESAVGESWGEQDEATSRGP